MADIDRVLKAVFMIEKFATEIDDEFVDRLNRMYVPSILVVFSVIMSIKQFVGDPINCWCPAEFVKAHVDYAHSMCWVSTQYYIPENQSIPADPRDRPSIGYYRWVPVIILSQGLLLFLVGLLWRLAHSRASFPLCLVLKTAMSCKLSLDRESRDKIMMCLQQQIHTYLAQSRSQKKGGCFQRLRNTFTDYCCFVCGRFYGNYLTAAYMGMKVVYIINSVVQVYFIDSFLGYGGTYYLYGFYIIWSMIHGKDWDPSDRFPLLIICDFDIRQFTNVKTYTLQCALPINLFNGKMFTFIWFLLFVLLVSTSWNFLHWASKLMVVRSQVSYVQRELRSMNVPVYDSEDVAEFTQQYLRRDGLLILRLVSKNAGDIIAAELLRTLWTHFVPKYKRNRICVSDETRPIITEMM